MALEEWIPKYVEAYKLHRMAKLTMRNMEPPKDYEAFKKDAKWQSFREVLLTEAGKKVEFRTLIMQETKSAKEFRMLIRKYNVGVKDDVGKTD